MNKMWIRFVAIAALAAMNVSCTSEDAALAGGLAAVGLVGGLAVAAACSDDDDERCGNYVGSYCSSAVDDGECYQEDYGPRYHEHRSFHRDTHQEYCYSY